MRFVEWFLYTNKTWDGYNDSHGLRGPLKCRSKPSATQAKVLLLIAFGKLSRDAVPSIDIRPARSLNMISRHHPLEIAEEIPGSCYGYVDRTSTPIIYAAPN